MADTKSLDQLAKELGYTLKNLIEEPKCIYKESPGSLVTFCKDYGKDYCEADCNYAEKMKNYD